jgi:hypothetical protein
MDDDYRLDELYGDGINDWPVIHPTHNEGKCT